MVCSAWVEKMKGDFENKSGMQGGGWLVLLPITLKNKKGYE